jgi:hypothetical protein
MDQFEYIIAISAIIVGLGIAHLLAGLGKTIYRLTGHGRPLIVSWVHLLWVANTFFWMIAYWWYSFSHAHAEAWSFAAYLLILPFPVIVYLQCVILYPHAFEDIDDLHEYFMETRKWFFALILAAIGADWILVILEPEATLNYIDELGLSVIVVVLFSAVVAITGILSENIRVHILIAITSLLLGIWQILDDHPTLGAVSYSAP